MTETLLLILFLVLLLHYIYFLTIIWIGLYKLKTEKRSNEISEFVSVIIPFRNESENILSCYGSLLNQNYPGNKFEIIFVNDSSTDDSFEKLINKNKSSTNSNVTIISVPPEYSANAHKKRAIRYGIENAKGDIIVTTDADCIHPKNWLVSLLGFFDDDTGFVSGPVEFISGSSLFNKIQKLEFAGLVTVGAGLIGANKPTICNAANTAYRKKVYNDVGGFSYQMKLSSGDDELLMQKIHKDTPYTVKFANDRNAIVSTLPNKTISEFYQQRKRWASKGLFYNDKFLVLKLILIYLFYISIPVQLILGIFISKIFFISFTSSISIKLLLEFFILKKGTKILFDKKMLRVFPIAEFFHIPYIIIAGISGVFGNYKWKNRKVNR